MSTLKNKDFAKVELIKSIIKGTQGRFFTITAKRKTPKKLEDGTIEHFMTMTGRIKVTKHLKGGKSTIAHKQDLISLYLSNGKGYRCFSAHLVTNITTDGNSFDFSRKRVLEIADFAELK